MRDVLNNDILKKPEKESVRGKLEYYQELIHQNEKKEQEENEFEK